MTLYTWDLHLRGTESEGDFDRRVKAENQINGALHALVSRQNVTHFCVMFWLAKQSIKWYLFLHGTDESKGRKGAAKAR
jgi:hypothetical protein